MERKIVEQLLLGTRLNEISRELHVSKRRVIMTRAKAEEAGYLDGGASLPLYPKALFPETPDSHGACEVVHVARAGGTPALDKRTS